MPTPLPVKSRVEARRASHSIDVIELWALVLGLAAAALATFVYLITRDGLGASFVLFGAAAMILTIWHVANRTRDAG
jgi:hypothetical protein